MTGLVRLGLVGLGRWGRVLAANVAALPGAALAAVATSRPPADFGLPAGCRVCGHWRDLLALGLDGLLIAAPPGAHAEIAEAALGRGLALFIEKPLTLDPQEARHLAQMAGASDSLVMVDHIHLFHPAFRRLKELAGGLGAVRRIEGRAGNHGPYRDDADVLWDWGPHDMAMAIDLMGRSPDQVAARRLERRAVEGGIGETVCLTLDFGPTTAVVTLGTLMDKCRTFTVECEGGALVYDGVGPVPLTLCRPGEAPAPVPCPDDKPLSVALGEFVAAVAERRRDRGGLTLGVRVVEQLARCAEVMEDGQ